MANTASAIKRVRTAARRRVINQPRRTAAKTLVNKAVTTANGGDAAQTQQALIQAVSALDRAAKVGAIHPNAAARRKSRLMLKINALLGGEALAGAAKPTRTAGRAAAAKATRQRIATSRATKAAGEQTAAGKARAALSRASRGETTTPAATPAETPAATRATTRTAGRTRTTGESGTTPGTRGTRASGGSTRPRKTAEATAAPTEPTADAGETGVGSRLRGLLGRSGPESGTGAEEGAAADAPKPRRTKKTS